MWFYDPHMRRVPGAKRGRFSILASLVALAGVAAAAYAISATEASTHFATGPIPPAAARACAGPITPVGHTETVNNTRPLGHAGWIGGIVVNQGYGAIKTVIEPLPHGRLAYAVLRGWRCSDGRRLRFWFSSRQLPWQGRGTAEQLATTGSARLTVRLAALRRLRSDTGGYVLFSSPGKWVIEASGEGHVVGTALFDFPT